MWTENELKHVRDQLSAELQGIQRSRAGLEREVAQSHGATPSGSPQPWSELSNLHAEEEVATRVLDVESELQTAIADAITRIDQNRYGVCEQCGKRITKERLRAVPHARHCMACAE